MTFLNPLFLLGLAAAAIPLIIHLFNFRRPRKVDFSSLAFLKELQKSTMQRVRIKQILLLILRTLAIACLVLAFARPTLTGNMAGSLGGRASSSIAIIIDNSRSMTMRDAQGEYFEQAREIAATLVDQSNAGDEFYILTPSRQESRQADPYNLPALALEAIEEIETAPFVDPLSEVWFDAVDLLVEANQINKEIYVISDLQRSTFGDSTAAAPATGIRTYLVPVGDRSNDNVAITSVDVTSRILEVGQPVRFEATLVNYGDDLIEGYVASVFLEGERVAQSSADLEPRIPKTVSFTATPQRRGWLSGVVQIEDDAFPGDNVRHFTLNVPEERRLLVVRGDGEDDSFVSLALSPQLTRGRVAFQVESINEDALVMQRLGGFDAVILVGIRTLSSGEVAALSKYIEEGGGVLFFPGEAGQAPDYNAFFAAVGGGLFSGFSGSTSSRQPVASFDRVDLEHPLFEGVFDQQRGFGEQISVENPSLFYTMNYTPGTATEQTLVHLSNGFPFLQEVRHGRGAILLFAVAPDARWSDWPQRGLFVPLIYRCMYHLSSSESVAGEQYVLGRTNELRIAGISESEPVRLISPEGEEYAPDQRNLLGALLLQLDPTIDAPGIYDVVTGDRLIRRVALNLDSQESDLSVLPVNDAAGALERIAGSIRVLDTSSGGIERAVEVLQEERTGIELWNVFLMLALIFMVAEMLVAKQWRPEAVPA